MSPRCLRGRTSKRHGGIVHGRRTQSIAGSNDDPELDTNRSISTLRRIASRLDVSTSEGLDPRCDPEL